MSTSIEKWKNFFESCDIPAEMGKKYAEIFVKQRMKADLLKELAKDDLRELGIHALGDQLAIIRYVKLCDGCPPEFSEVANNSARIVIPTQKHRRDRSRTFSDDDEPMPMESIKPISKAPDRHDVYHVKMPEGNTQRSKNILQMHSALRDQGLIKRGVSGVRRGGIELHRVAHPSKIIQKSSLTKPGAVGVVVQDTDITSSTAGGIIPLGTLRSDAISTKTTVVKDATSPIKGANNRRINSQAAGGHSALRVELALPAKKHLPFSQRKVVNYREDVEFLVDEEEPLKPVRQQPKRKIPITQRIKLVERRNSSPNFLNKDGASAIRKTSRKRPVITIGGQQLTFGAGKTLARGSILDRITMK